MPGSGPPVPDLVLDAIRDGATFRLQKGDLGVLVVDTLPCRLAIRPALAGREWYLDPDAGSYISAGTYEALMTWAASREAAVRWSSGPAFAVGLYPESEGGVPIARVALMGIADPLQLRASR